MHENDGLAGCIFNRGPMDEVVGSCEAYFNFPPVHPILSMDFAASRRLLSPLPTSPVTMLADLYIRFAYLPVVPSAGPYFVQLTRSFDVATPME